MAARASATDVFAAGVREGPAEDFGLHGLAAERAFELVSKVLEFLHAADRDDFLVGSDWLLLALWHAAPPLILQAWGDAVQPGGGDRHAGQHGLRDQPDLVLGSVTVGGARKR